MRAYVITTGAIFGLLAAAHVWRILGENRQLARDPSFIIITAISAALCVWAFRVVKRSSASK